MFQNEKRDDFARMQKNMQLKATLEQMEKEQSMKNQNNLNNQYQKVIGFNNQQRE